MNRVRSALLCCRIVSTGLSPVCLCIVSCSLHDGLAEGWLKPQESDLLDKLIQLWRWWKPSICNFKILKQFMVPLYPFRGSQNPGHLAVVDEPPAGTCPSRSITRLTSPLLVCRHSFPCLAVGLNCFFLLFPSSLSLSSDFIHRRGKVYLTLFV